ncbi:MULTISPECIES: hypothetical protein [Hafnia]|jgi:hypothetical protein|uniref:Uncharacterized protein n=1 Tax=Hafnia paralvei TaxID=546367 RepID=A0A4Q9ER60_9GAMM|nr:MULTISPECIES: hypothetical protein [Hafnia]OFS11058.1 hypothetical protein HMPREF3091_07650 [Hafnia sp. HMSC23F03]TBM29879.1 hypothetical protein EYY89_05490 [Hafnia paralvei]
MTNKFWIRWGCIVFICIVYFAVIFFFNFIFSLDLTETMSAGGQFTHPQCVAFIDGLVAEHDNATLASLVGFLICMPLILWVFKKVR